MKQGELTINGKDAYGVWGVYAEDGTLSALMTPAPLKAYITNSIATDHGKSVVTAPVALPKVDERDFQITLILRADSTTQFYQRYTSFVNELQGGIIEIKTMYQPNVCYRCLYTSCKQFSQYNGTLAKFSLKLNEPNPMNRSV